MEIQAEEKSFQRAFIREYEVFHKDDPDKKVKLRTPRSLTATQVKEKVVSNGLFDRDIISELRVERKQR